MKKSIFKLLAASIILIGSFGMVSCSNDDDEVENIVPESQLPDAAKTFLSQYFNGVQITKVDKETVGMIVVYEVELENGFDLVFNSDGEWTEVDAPDGKTIPSGIAPDVIEQYVNNNYSGYGINEINKTGYGYNVVLTNMQGGTSITLQFNESGEVINDPM